MKRKIITALKILLGLYLLGGLLLFLFQDRLLFHPKPVPIDYHFRFDQPYEEANLSFGKNRISILRFRTGDEPRKGIVLFFHGNVGNMEHYAPYPFLFTRNAYEVWMVDYPGFGKSTGHLSEGILYEQAQYLYDLATTEVPGDSIVIYGKSLGTGIASYLASTRLCQQLILESPYYDVPALARHYFPIYPGFLAHFSLSNASHLARVKVPVTIIHGTDDEVVPYAQGKKLAALRPGIDFISIPGGRHNNLATFPLFQEKIDSILAN